MLIAGGQIGHFRVWGTMGWIDATVTGGTLSEVYGLRANFYSYASFLWIAAGVALPSLAASPIPQRAAFSREALTLVKKRLFLMFLGGCSL